MGEDFLTTLSIENHHPSTLLSMDPSAGLVLSSSHEDMDRELLIQRHQVVVSVAPDINLPLPADRYSSQQPWNSDSCDTLDVCLGPQTYDAETTLHVPGSRPPASAPSEATAFGVRGSSSVTISSLCSQRSRRERSSGMRMG
ncbi:unnamed protein product [Musa textilis]